MGVFHCLHFVLFLLRLGVFISSMYYLFFYGVFFLLICSHSLHIVDISLQSVMFVTHINPSTISLLFGFDG